MNAKLDENARDNPSTERGLTNRIIFGIVSAAVLGTAGIGIWLASTYYRTAPAADHGAAANNQTSHEPSAADIRAAIETTVRGYMDAPNHHERCRWVVDGNRAASAMREFYARPEVTPPQGFSRILKIAPAAFDGFPMHIVVAAEPNEKTAHMLSVFPVGGKMLIDWESSVTLGDQSWGGFLTVKPTYPTQMRVYLQRDRYYNFGFADDSLWDNYEVTTRGHPEKVPAYVESGSELARRLQVIVRPGSIQPVNVRLKWDDKGHALVITDLLHNYWIDVERLHRISSKADAPQNIGSNQ